MQTTTQAPAVAPSNKAQKAAAYKAKAAAEKAARKAAQDEKTKLAERTAAKVETEFLNGVTELLRLIEKLQPEVEALKKNDDSLAATLLRRKLHKLRMQYVEKAKILTVRAKTARAAGSMVLAASRTKTVSEQARYDARQARLAEKLAEEARQAAIIEKAAENPTQPLTHDTRVSSVGAKQPVLPAIVEETGNAFQLASVEAVKESVHVPVTLRTQDYAGHGIYNTENRYAN